MDNKYRLVERRSMRKSDGEKSNSSACPGGSSSSTPPALNELRITQQGKPRNYISHAMNLLQGSSDKDDEGATSSTENVKSRSVILKAMGRSVNKSVTIAEILKRKLPLHQITELSSCELIDVYKPLEEGLDVVETKRFVSCMKITLRLDPLDTTNIGYQPPLTVELQSGS